MGSWPLRSPTGGSRVVRFAGTLKRVPDGEVNGVALLVVRRRNRKVIMARSMLMVMIILFCGFVSQRL